MEKLISTTLPPSIQPRGAPPWPTDDLSVARDLYSDATLVHHGKEHKVHRLILHKQSGYFAKAFGGGWQESNTKTISIDDEFRPEAVKAMLDFFYGENYRPTNEKNVLKFHLEVAMLADYYRAPRLLEFCCGNFRAACVTGTCHPIHLVAVVKILDGMQGMQGYDMVKKALVANMKSNLVMLLTSSKFTDMLSEYKELNKELLSSLSASQRNPADDYRKRQRIDDNRRFYIPDDPESG